MFTNFTGMTISSGVASNIIWTVADSSKVDLYTGTVGSVSFAAGSLYGFQGDFSTSETLRDASDSPQFNAAAIGQANATPPANVAVYSFAFQVKPGETLQMGTASFNLGTANTSGTPYTSGNAGTDLGTYNIRITDGSNTWTYFPSNQAIPIPPGNNSANSMPLLSATPDSQILLSAGNYRFDILHANKATAGNFNQRTTLDNFSLSAVPEPSTYAIWGGGATLGLVFWLRRRRH